MTKLRDFSFKVHAYYFLETFFWQGPIMPAWRFLLRFRLIRWNWYRCVSLALKDKKLNCFLSIVLHYLPLAVKYKPTAEEIVNNRYKHMALIKNLTV